VRLANKTLERLKEKSYMNAVRLLRDACLLFGKDSYATALALAVLSQEEIGKLKMVDHICDDIILNGNRSHFTKHLFSRDMFYRHINKQAWADEFGLDKFVPGRLEKTKQDALYVDYGSGRVRHPSVNKKKSLRYIRHTLHLIADVGDLGFNGFECASTAATRRRARKIVSELSRHFADATVKKP